MSMNLDVIYQIYELKRELFRLMQDARVVRSKAGLRRIQKQIEEIELELEELGGL